MNVCRFLLALLLLSTPAAAAQDALVVHFFYGDGCPHCAREEVLLQELESRGNLRVERYEVYFSPENLDLLERVAERLQAYSPAVPFLVIGDEYVVGYDDHFTPEVVRTLIAKCLPGGCTDAVRQVLGAGQPAVPPPPEAARPDAAPGTPPEAHPQTISIPMLGDIDPRSFSLPLLTVVMGFLDGFNPCAMWALIFLIGLLLGMRNRARMWLLGTAFIVASAFVYFLFMAAWLNLILFFGLVMWVRVGIGLIAVGGGLFSLRDALAREEISCRITGDRRRREFRARLQDVIGQHSLLLSLAGITLLAFMVNLVEIVCSAGFPAIYTQVLSLNDLPTWKYYAYILLYILFFMLDDLIVFAAAMLTLEVTGATTTYVRYARLLGGALMVGIGLLLILRPQWLMFG
jgi:glutaredoxin